MPQLIRGDVVDVLSHIYGRQIAFKSRVITLRGTVNGVPLGKNLATMTNKYFDPKSPTNKFENLMVGVSTACRSLGYTHEAAKFARRYCFSIHDKKDQHTTNLLKATSVNPKEHPANLIAELYLFISMHDELHHTGYIGTIQEYARLEGRVQFVETNASEQATATEEV